MRRPHNAVLYPGHSDMRTPEDLEDLPNALAGGGLHLFQIAIR
ncbi:MULTISPECIES: hypothetical protein [Mesorhizobium]|nr:MULTISPECIES: hypothetical protein [Mesorhizobium]